MIPEHFGNRLLIIRRGLLIRSDPVFIHGMNDRSKITAYCEDSRGAPWWCGRDSDVWLVVRVIFLVGVWNLCGSLCDPVCFLVQFLE